MRTSTIFGCSRLATGLILACALAVPGAARADDPPAKPNVLDLPGIQAAQAVQQQAAVQLIAQGKLDEAEKLLRQSIERIPFDAQAHYNLACVLARTDKKDDAFASLNKAIELGFRDKKHIEADEDFKSIRDDERFAAALKATAEPLKELPGWKYDVAPAPIKEGQAEITAANLGWDARLGVFRAALAVDPAATADKPIAEGLGKAGDLLRQWYKEKTAAGNHGDFYDNHDTDHSNMNYGAFPQLTRIEFSEEVKKRHLHHGLQLAFLFNARTIGNSSTALTNGPFWRGQGRNALLQPRGGGLLYVQYLGNHLYFYPEHRDHDVGHNGKDGQGHGDVSPANVPYYIISQGSSGSDIAFMNAIAATLAAFRPEVKEELTKTGLLMPTVQMIFRMSNKLVEKPEDYLTGKAHPTVFDSQHLDIEKMVTLAHSITGESLPPLVQLKIVEEDQPVVGRDYFDVAPREHLLNTPCAIARVVKSSKYERRMVLSAADSRDLRKKELKFHWVVLRGDPQRIEIKTLGERGATAEIKVGYHERRPVLPGDKLESNRVDIGIFAHNGDHYSAPAFVSFLYLDNEKRAYDDQHRIVSIDYTDPECKDNYVDPLVDFAKNWRDEYHYGKDGSPTGWTRLRGKDREEFTADGRLIVSKDDQGQPTKTAPVRYLAEQKPNQPGQLIQKVAE